MVKKEVKELNIIVEVELDSMVKGITQDRKS